MNAMSPEEFEKVLTRQEAELARMKATLDEQSALLDTLKAECAKLGLDKNPPIALEDFPPEYQARFLEFERDLKQIDEILTPSRPKAKAPKIGRRMAI